MIDLSTEIRSYLKAVRADVTAQINQHNFIASGAMKRNFRVVANQNLVGEIRGLFYMNFLTEEGAKKPTRVGRKFVDNIIEWMRFRGIQPKRKNADGNYYPIPNTTSNIKRSAYAIATGIVENGTPATRREKNLDIVGAMNRHKRKYLQDVGKEFLLTFSNRLTIK